MFHVDLTIRKVFDGRVIVDENTEIMDRRASQNEYFHKDFHSILNMGIHYVGEHYGKEALTEFLTAFTHHVYTPVLTAIKEKGLAAIQEKILDTYHREKAEDAVETSLTGDTLTVTVYYCPAVRHLLGHRPDSIALVPLHHNRHHADSGRRRRLRLYHGFLMTRPPELPPKPFHKEISLHTFFLKIRS